MKKRILAFILILVLALGTVPSYAATEPELEAAAAILIDATTGKVLYEKDAHSKQSPGVATMMLTGLLSLENLDTTDYITVAAEDIKDAGRSSISLKADESINVGSLITATMTVAARDGASVLAKQVSGSQDAFAQLMNDTVASLGLNETHFVNATGATADNHYSSAYDLAKIAKHCIENEVFVRVTSKSTFSIPQTNKANVRNLSNNNLILYDETARSRVYVDNILRHCKYDGATGIISGYASETGGVVVASATRQGTSLIAVVLKSGEMSRFADTIKLLDYGFNNFKTVRVGDANFNTGSVSVLKGKSKTVDTVVKEVLNATISANASASSVATNAIFDELTAPIEEGQKVGTMQLISNNQVVAEYDIVAANSVEKGFSFNLGGGSIIVKILLGILCVFLALVLVLAIFLLNEKRKSEQRKRARARRRAEASKQAEDEDNEV